MIDINVIWEITVNISITIMTLMTAVCCGYFVRPYLRAEKTAVYAGMVYFFVMMSLYVIPTKLSNFTAYTLGILAAFIVMCIGDRRNTEQKIFLAVTFFSIRWLGIAMADKIVFTLEETVRKKLEKDIAGREWRQFGIYVGFDILNIGICFLFLVASIRLLNRAFKYKSENMTKKELLMMSMPSLVGMTGYGILKAWQDIYVKEIGKALPSVDGIGVFSFLHYLISVISILVMVTVFQNLKASQIEMAGEKLIQSQIADMKEHIREVEKLYQDIRMLRHDMGNHIQTIEHLLDKNEKEKAAEYAAGLKQKWQDTSMEIRSGNPVTDVILAEKKRRAVERNIRFACDFYYSEEDGVDAFDVSVILNNALDNALESANGASPCVSISSYRKNNIFMIVVSNSYAGKLVTDGETDLPLSGKGGSGHGLGLANIRRVANKYLGDIVLEQEKDKVILTVMLQV